MLPRIDRCAVITTPGRWPSSFRLLAHQLRSIGIEGVEPFINGRADALPLGIPGHANEGEPSASYRGLPGSYWHRLAFLAIVRSALVDGIDTLAILEDDALLTPEGGATLATFEAPPDWELIYLGGMHGFANGGNVRLSPHLLRLNGSVATHAVIYRKSVFDRLLALPEDRPIDQGIADVLHPEGRTFACWPQAFIQAPGPSQITGEVGGEAFLWVSDGVGI